MPVVVSPLTQTIPLEQHVRNETGAVILAGSLVYVSGVNASKVNLIRLADPLVTNRRAQMYVATNIRNNSSGIAYSAYQVPMYDTSGYPIGSPVYLAVGGSTSLALPSAVSQQVVGWVSVANTVNGEIMIDIPSGQVLPSALNTTVSTTVDVVSTTTETALVTATLAGNSIGSSGVVHLRMRGDCLYNNSTSDTLTLKVNLGGTGILVPAALGGTPGGLSANRVAWVIEIDIMNLGVASSQYSTLKMSMSHPSTAITGTGTNILDAGLWVGSSAIDTTSSQALSVTAQWSAASANNSLRMFAAELTFS